MIEERTTHKIHVNHSTHNAALHASNCKVNSPPTRVQADHSFRGTWERSLPINHNHNNQLVVFLPILQTYFITWGSHGQLRPSTFSELLYFITGCQIIDLLARLIFGCLFQYTKSWNRVRVSKVMTSLDSGWPGLIHGLRSKAMISIWSEMAHYSKNFELNISCNNDIICLRLDRTSWCTL